MRAGIALSLLGHVALVALAVWALPWLRARPGTPVPAIAVSFISDAELAALARRAAEAQAPPPPAAVPIPKRTRLAPRFEAPPEPEGPERPVPEPEDFPLAPAFDAASPLGFPVPAETPGEEPEALPDAPDPVAAAPAEEARPADLGVLRARHLAALQAAAQRARVYPPAARGRGLMGVARLYLVVARDGSLIEVQLVASSGSVTLDQAAVDAARRARWPKAPDALPGESFGFVQDLEFEAQ